MITRGIGTGLTVRPGGGGWGKGGEGGLLPYKSDGGSSRTFEGAKAKMTTVRVDTL